MIYLIVGGSCAGKSSFVNNKWVKNKKGTMKKDILPYFETEDSILLGIYDNEQGRRIGTDRINRKDIKKILPQIITLYNKSPEKDIILEGDKIVSRPLWNGLIENKIECKVYLIECSPEKSIERNRKNNSTNKESTLKASCTRAKNIFNEYKDIFNGEIINSENIKDFSKFGINI